MKTKSAVALPRKIVSRAGWQQWWRRPRPNPMGDEAKIEIRQIFERADFGEALTPELRAGEEMMAAQMAKNALT